jgi:hypothetical protein
VWPPDLLLAVAVAAALQAEWGAVSLPTLAERTQLRSLLPHLPCDGPRTRLVVIC